MESWPGRLEESQEVIQFTLIILSARKLASREVACLFKVTWHECWASSRIPDSLAQSLFPAPLYALLQVFFKDPAVHNFLILLYCIETGLLTSKEDTNESNWIHLLLILLLLVVVFLWEISHLETKVAVHNCVQCQVLKQ